MNQIQSLAAAGAICLLAAHTAHAAPVFNADVTPDVIFGSGNANGAWTLDRSSGIELGLRAKVRFDENNQPQNIFNYQGNIGSTGVYKFSSGTPGGQGFGFAANSPSTASWNFEWSVNTDWDGSSGLNLDDLTYEIGIDFDPGLGTNFLIFDPITLAGPVPDHAIGDNTTGNGAGVDAGGDAGVYAGLLAANNVAQNSWNMEFFDGPGFPFLGSNPGVYDFYLSASLNGQEIARTTMSVHVSAPATLALVGLGLVGASIRRKHRS